MLELTLLVSLSRYFSEFVMFRINMNLSLVCVSETGKMKMSLSCVRGFVSIRVGDQDFVLRVVQEKFSVF